MKKKTGEIQTISKNRKAHQKFTILECCEAGIVLHGHEVKSLRQGRCSIDESLIRMYDNEAYLFNVYIPPYAHLSHVAYEPDRNRKLLLHRKEIQHLTHESQVQGLSIVPLELYFKNGKVKVAVALVKGKKAHDRREELKKRDSEREIRKYTSH